VVGAATRQDATDGRSKPRPYKRIGEWERGEHLNLLRLGRGGVVLRWVVEGGDAGGVGDWLGGIEDDAAEVGVAIVEAEGVAAVEGGDAAEEELGDVGDGHGVAAVNALAGELADEVAEEEVDRVGS
jgi:hypothetical protein